MSAMGINDLGFNRNQAKIMYSTDFELESMFNGLDFSLYDVTNKDSVQQFADKYNEYAEMYGLDKLQYDFGYQYDKIDKWNEEIEQIRSEMNSIDMSSEGTSYDDKKKYEKLSTEASQLQKDVEETYDVIEKNLSNAVNIMIGNAKQARDTYWEGRDDVSTISTDSYNNVYSNDTDAQGGAKPTKKLSSGERVSHAQGITHSSGKIKDKAWDNFKLEFNGNKYTLETTEEVLPDDIKLEVEDLFAKSGSELSQGQVIEYKGKLYIVTETGTIRGIKARTNSGKSYDNLYNAYTGNV
jgi:hypothetical protein